MIDAAGFLLGALVIFLTGRRLSYYGEVISELSGISKAWTGLVLMAMVTSLPELMSGISSAAIVKSADLAVSDIFGSCAFNLCILALLDALVPEKKSILSKASSSHILAAALGLILFVLAGLGLVMPEDIILTPSIGITSLLFLLIYLLSIRMIFRFQKQTATKEKVISKETGEQVTLRKAVVRYILFASIIVVAALSLPFFAERIAENTGLGKSFVGTLFLAASTSLPEVAVSIAAVRSGSIDMAVGNLFGSNIFNFLVLFIDDLAYTDGHILKNAAEVNIVSVFSIILMTAIAIIGLTYKVGKKRFLLAYDALMIATVYILNLVWLYTHS